MGTYTTYITAGSGRPRVWEENEIRFFRIHRLITAVGFRARTMRGARLKLRYDRMIYRISITGGRRMFILSTNVLYFVRYNL